jgi:hypothetical protein
MGGVNPAGGGQADDGFQVAADLCYLTASTGSEREGT